MNAARRGVALLVAAATCAAGVAIASQHPVARGVAVASVIAWTAFSARWPQVWWFTVPAALPVLDFSPWTGALIFDEFDLLLLATLAGGWWRVAFDLSPPASGLRNPAERVLNLLLGLACLSMTVALVHGLLEAGGPWFGAFQGEADPLNSVRVTKSVFFALLFSPLVRRDLAQNPGVLLRRFARGMWAGMTIVVASVLAERSAFPGLLDFSDSYRTTALFWEMHFGGAAIDVYIAVGTPFAAWAVWSARSALGRLVSALLALGWGWVCLMTFSRGVWLAALLSLGLLAVALRAARLARGERRWRRVGDAALLAALIAQVVVVATTGSFMSERLTASDRDLTSRRTHWGNGVRLLASPADWAFGIGSGRLPARYAAEAPRGEFSGSARAVAATPRESTSFVTLDGPRKDPSLGGLFLLTQRVPLRPGVRYEVDLSIRTRADTQFSVAVCEVHLLYFRSCQDASSTLRASRDGAWQRVKFRLAGPALEAGRWFAPRGGVLALSVGDAGGRIDVTDVALHAGPGGSLVRNGRFVDGLAGWFPFAQSHFLPWHIDNFLLETMIERGVVGVLASAALVCFALVSTLRPARSPAADSIAPFLGAALVAVLLVGAVSSVQDAPRVAFAFWLLVIVSAQLRVAQLRTTALAPERPSRPNAVFQP